MVVIDTGKAQPMPPVTIENVTTFLTIVSSAIGVEPLHKLLDQIAGEQHGLAAPRIPSLETADELMADAGSIPPMLVDRLLPDHSLFLLTGKPKAGKSYLALDIADAVSRGSAVLNALPVNRPGPVLYLAMEDGKPEIARRLSQRTSIPNPQPLTPNPLFFISEPFSLTDPLNYLRFRELAARHKPSLIVIDTAAEALDIRDWINRADILAKIAPIRRLARDLCTILLVAHNRKAEGDGGDEIAGSNALAGAVDGWISAHKVERRPNGNRRLFLRIEGRGGVGHELIAEMDHESLHFHLIADEQAELDAQASREQTIIGRRRERKEQMLKMIRGLGNKVTISEVAAAMAMQYRTAWALMRELTALHEVEEVEPEESARAGNSTGRPSPRYRAIDLSARDSL